MGKVQDVISLIGKLENIINNSDKNGVTQDAANVLITLTKKLYSKYKIKKEQLDDELSQCKKDLGNSSFKMDGSKKQYFSLKKDIKPVCSDEALNKMKQKKNYDYDINYDKNNVVVPDRNVYDKLIETVREIVRNNWSNKNLSKRLSHSTKSYSLTDHGIDLNGDDITIPELLKVNENYFMNTENNSGKINIDDRETDIFVITDKVRPDGQKYLQNSGNGELKRFLNNAATDFNVVNFSSDYRLRISFVALWLNIYETVFEEIYKLEPKFNKNNLNIMFKGGVTLRAIILTAYIDFNLIDEANIYNEIKNIIKISDFDFEIVTSYPQAGWDIINKLNLINYFVMCEVLEYFELNKNHFFTLFQYNRDVKSRLATNFLEIIKKEVADKKLKYDERKQNTHEAFNQYADYYANIEPLFIELENYNDPSANIYSEPIESIFEKYLDKNQLAANFSGQIQQLYSKFSLTTGEKNTNSRNNFGIVIDGSRSDPPPDVDPDKIYIDPTANNGIISDDQMRNLYDVKFTRFKDKLGLKNYNKNNNFYATSNTNVFMVKQNGASVMDFQLNRIKYSYCLFYRIQVNEEYKYHRVFVAGEVFDLSHAGARDQVKKHKTSIPYDNNEYIDDFSILGFKWPYDDKQIRYLGYSLYGHVKDMEDIIFNQKDYKPWDDIKYGKRINRILHCLFVDLFLGSNYKGVTYYDRLDVVNKFISNFKNNKFDSFDKKYKLINMMNNNFKLVVEKHSTDKNFNAYKKTVLDIMTTIQKIFVQRYIEPELLTYNSTMPIDFEIFGIKNYSIY